MFVFRFYIKVRLYSIWLSLADISLNRMPSRLLHNVVNGKISFFFMAERYPIVYMQLLLSRFSHVWLFVTPWMIAHQAPLSIGFSRQDHWSGLPFPPPGDLPPKDQTHISYVSWVASRFLTTSAIWEAPLRKYVYEIT